MMARFEEETVRYLYLMQIIDAAEEQRLREQADRNQQAAQFSGGSAPTADATDYGNGAKRQRRAQTTLDELEEEFQRKKRRELDQARMAGAGEQQHVQQVVRGEKVGRNDPCPCGSGKKHKKCCGA